MINDFKSVWHLLLKSLLYQWKNILIIEIYIKSKYLFAILSQPYFSSQYMENFENTYVYYYTAFRFQFLLIHVMMLIFLLPSDENFSWELLEFLIVFDSLKFHSNVSWWGLFFLLFGTLWIPVYFWEIYLNYFLKYLYLLSKVLDFFNLICLSVSVVIKTILIILFFNSLLCILCEST